MENQFKVGDKVQISQQSEFHHQGIKNGKKLVGEITSLSDWSTWQYNVRWEDSNSYLYNDRDLVVSVGVEPKYEIY